MCGAASSWSWARQRPIEEDAVQDEIRSLLWSQKVNACVAEIRRELVEAAYIEPADLFEGP